MNKELKDKIEKHFITNVEKALKMGKIKCTYCTRNNLPIASNFKSITLENKKLQTLQYKYICIECLKLPEMKEVINILKKGSDGFKITKIRTLKPTDEIIDFGMMRDIDFLRTPEDLNEPINIFLDDLQKRMFKNPERIQKIKMRAGLELVEPEEEEIL